MSLYALWCSSCGTLAYSLDDPRVHMPRQMHRPQRHTCESQHRGHHWLAVGRVDVQDVIPVTSVDVLWGAGGSPPVEARSAGSEGPEPVRHPHPSVTTAMLPRGSHPLPPKPSSARGEGTPSNRCVLCRAPLPTLEDVWNHRCPFASGDGS